MTEFHFLVQLIPRSKYMDFFFNLQYLLLQCSYYKKETASFILIICKQFITAGTVSRVTALYCIHPGSPSYCRIHLLWSVKWGFYAILLLVSCSFIFVISITSKHLLCFFFLSCQMNEQPLFCINASIMNLRKINPSSQYIVSLKATQYTQNSSSISMH